MKIAIDENVCLKHHLSLEEVLMALTIRSCKDMNFTLNNLQAREVAVLQGNKYMVTQHWSDVLDEILCDSSKEGNNEDRLRNLARKMMDCFPDGKMPGTAYYYRCNVREVSLKLKKFFLLYGEYPDEDIIDATKRFVASYKGDYKYMPLLKYFISKNKKVLGEDEEYHVQEVSELATYLENKGGTSVEEDDDWLISSRN